MSIKNFPFTIIQKNDIARPYLPITITNPLNNKQLNVFALIDTGADECAFPASFSNILGHKLKKGIHKKISTGNGDTVAYGHTVNIKTFNYSTEEILIDFLPNLNMPLLGVKNFLDNFILKLDYPAQEITIQCNKNA